MLKHDQRQDKLIDELERYEQNGVALYIDDYRATPYEIAEKLCLREESGYMADYVEDAKGLLAQIRYDHIESR